MRRGAGVVAAVAALALLTGCTAVGDQTEQLADELLAFEIVEGGFASSGEWSPFDRAYSSISLDVREESTADQLDDLVTFWRFGVDGIDARWSLGLTKPGEGSYDDFRVVGARSVADLTTMVRFWHGLGPSTRTVDIGVNDYDPDGDGSVRLDLGVQPSARLHEPVLGLQQQAYDLPGRFTWSVDAEIPAGTISVASDNVLPGEHMLDLLAAIAEPPVSGGVGPIWFWAIESPDIFQPGEPQRLDIGVYLEPPSIDDLGADDQQSWQDLGDRVLADPDVWPVIQEIAARLPRDETEVRLSFWVHGDQVAKLDPLDCVGDSAESIFGPLNSDVWQSWGGQDC